MSTPEPHAPGTLQSFKRGHVGHVVFNNPRKFNAMNYDMWAALPQVMQDFVDDADIRVIVLSGAGDKAFVSGADISQFDTMRTGDANLVYSQASEAGYAAVLDCPKPTVAQIQGICMGGGLGLALNCDMRMYASNAKLELRKNPEQRDMALMQAMVNACFASQDYQEGRQAFAAKRPPVFKGH